MSSAAARRILIVRVGAMGDVLHGMPAVAALRQSLPQARIGWAIEPRWASLLQSPGTKSPLVDTVHLVEAKAWSKHPLSSATWRSVRALRSALRSEQYDIVIDLQGSIRSALIARASGAPRVVGSDTPRETPARWLYTERVSLTRPHVVDQAAEIVSAAVRLTLQSAPVTLPVDTAAEAWCDSLFEGRHERAVFLAPTAGWRAKEWPARRYGELARALHAQGLWVLVNASPNGTDAVAQEVVSASEHTAEAVACTLPQLTALLRRVHLAIAGDTGPLHLAAALQVPAIALFGPTDPLRNGPYGMRSVVLRDPASQTSYSHTSAADLGLMNISVQDVLNAASQLLDVS